MAVGPGKLILLVAQALLLVAAGAWAGAAWERASHAKWDTLRVASDYSAALGRDIAILERLRAGKLRNAQSLLEFSVNSGLVMLDRLMRDGELSSGQKATFEFARNYRRENPFDPFADREHVPDWADEYRERIKRIVD